MRRVTAVLSMLGLPADRARWSADYGVGRDQQTPGEEEGSLPSCHPPGVDMGRHKQAHTGVQRVLTKLQLRWYWPSMGQDVQLKVRQCEICQASRHGPLPGEAGQQRLYARRPWQVVAVDLVGPMPLTPREAVGS